MSKPVVVTPDAEVLAKDYLKPLFAARGKTVSWGVGVPQDWTPDAGDHMQVELDGTPVGEPPVWVRSTVRITAWSASRTRAKDLAALAQGLLLAHPGDGVIAGVRFGTGLIVGYDRTARANLASTTSLVRLRLQPA